VYVPEGVFGLLWLRQSHRSMIDVLRPNTVDVSSHITANGSFRRSEGSTNPVGAAEVTQDHDTDEAAEQAWLNSVQSAEISQIKTLQRGALVMDISLLRDHTQSSSARKASKATTHRP